MKNNTTLFGTGKAMLFGFLFTSLVSCNNLEDNDYYADSSTLVNNSELEIVNMSSEDYIHSRSDLSMMDNLFSDNGIYEELTEKNQLSTILVVTNTNFEQPEGTDDDITFATRAHISDVSISPANIYDGERLMMWHSKYVSITVDSIGSAGNYVGHILFNNASVEEIIQTNNGYIYVISEMINTPISLYDFIESLGDEYSTFRELVLASGGKEFDQTNSTAIGVNDEGNTVYDSVFIYTNAHFEDVGVDLSSESLTATLLLPSNDVIDEAMDDAHERLKKWGLEREDSVLRNWILDVCFFSEYYDGSDLQNEESNDITSMFGKQWRTNAHEIDKNNPTSLSNAIVYEVTKLHLPNNVLVYRLKDWFYYYENCTSAQKEEYFKMTNMVFSNCSTEVTKWSPLSGVWPEVEDRVLILTYGDDGITGSYRLDFTPLKLETNEDGSVSVSPYTIPPGAYRLAMGFKQNMNMSLTVAVLVDGEEIAKSETITVGSATTYHYDRGSTLSDTYPEGYVVSEVTAAGGSSKAANYDTDGGPIISEVVIPDVNNGAGSQITLRIEGENWNDQSKITLNHWCLRPTTNNY